MLNNSSNDVKELFTKTSIDKNSVLVILPKILNGSNKVTNEIIPDIQNIIVKNKIEYLKTRVGFLKANFFLFQNLFLNLVVKSIKIPNGHILEQYTRPKSIVKISIMKKPANSILTPKFFAVKNSKIEGINCNLRTME